VAEECTVSDEYKRRILKANDISTVVTGRRNGHPVRALKTPFTRSYSRLEATAESDEELHGVSAGALRAAAQKGDAEHGYFMAGQVAGMVHAEQPAADIVSDLLEGAERSLKEATKWVR
jgi:enoyl-[acyl-carrier protein] reductase II